MLVEIIFNYYCTTDFILMVYMCCRLQPFCGHDKVQLNNSSGFQGIGNVIVYTVLRLLFFVQLQYISAFLYL